MSRDAPRIRIEPLAPGAGPDLGAFAEDLRRGTGRGTQFLPAMPSGEDAWNTALVEGTARTRPLSEAALERVLARHAVLGAGPRADANARLLAAPSGHALAVITGQQPGLLGGPLLTFHKVAGAIDLARKLDGIGEQRVVPVFWTASEDHDFDEANRAGVIGRDGQRHALRVDAQGDGRSIRDLPVDGAARQATLDALAALLPDTERGREALALAAPESGDDHAEWSVRTLLRVFGDSGLVVIEPEQLYEEVGPTLTWLLDQSAPIQASIVATGEALQAAGFPAPLEPEPGATPLFLREEVGGRRLRVSVEGSQVSLRGTPSALDLDGLRSALGEPGRGCGNVVGRVFIQNRHVPVLAYIAGPSEIAYQAQLRAAAERIGEPFPLALSRPEATWVDEKARRTAEAFELAIGAVLRGAEPEPGDGDGLEALEQALRTHFETWPEPVRQKMDKPGRGGPALRRLVEQLGARLDKALPGLRAAFQADAGVGRGRFDRMQDLVRPAGRPQERWLSPFSLIARHGLMPVREGLLALDALAPAHQLVHILPENAS